MSTFLTDQPEPLGLRIARLRTERGWTQEDLAERLAASRVAISHFEIGIAIPSERTIVLLAGLFKLEPHELVAGTNYPPAKAERLPFTTCRYTELELQLALLQHDLVWLKRHPEERETVFAEWHMRLQALDDIACYAQEHRLIKAAWEQLQQFSSVSKAATAGHSVEH